jgi:formylglycine-generating enzyme required for sulfatase activity
MQTLARVIVLVAAAAGLSGAAPSSRAVLLDDGMVRVPRGTFVQGHDDADRADESPAHIVDISTFDLDATLVTRKQFSEFVAATHYVTTAEKFGVGIGSQEGMADWTWERIPHASWRRPFVHQQAGEQTADERAFLADDAPVVMVSFDDAVAYCTHFGKRLPTEAEWEYAMRAGSNGTRYPWGNDPKVAGQYRLNFWQGTSHRENLRSDGFVYVSPVRAFPPNAWGIYDAVGNVWQWTADFYAPNAYGAAASEQKNDQAAHDPTGPSSGKERVLRGGSWWCGACTCEGNGLFYRGKSDPEAPFNNNGFRCARGARAR